MKPLRRDCPPFHIAKAAALVVSNYDGSRAPTEDEKLARYILGLWCEYNPPPAIAPSTKVMQ
jgi:hypothetical protein